MKAQREYGLSLSWARVTTVFLIDVALLVIASHLPDSWQADRNLTLWIGVGLAVILTVVALLTNGECRCRRPRSPGCATGTPTRRR